MMRRTLLVVLAGAVAVSSVATWVAAEQIRSPAEAAARTAPPAAAPILVPVVEQELSTRVVTRGTAHYGSPRKLRVTASSLKGGAGRVVTTVPRDGTVVSSGDVVLTISGRPVFVLSGRQPSYRDLGPGMRGPDVRQLERGLRAFGLPRLAVDGVYDASTERAVVALYRRHGFAPLRADEAGVAAARPPEALLLPGAVAHAGVQVPADEVVFVQDAPLRVTKLHVQPGDAPSGPLATVTDSDVVVEGFVRVEQVDRLRTGGKVLVQEPALGIDTVGRLASIASRPGTRGADGFHVFFEVAVPDPPRALVGASVRLEVPVRSTGTARLTVPLAAVSLGPDGGARVQRAVRDGFEFVPVETGFSADGYVAVEPRSGALAAGDEVVVGFKRGGSG